VTGPQRSHAEAFLDRHPALRTACARSTVWSRVRDEARIDLGGSEAYIVAGDTLGGEPELLLDRLARGANASGADPLSRALFLELPTELQTTVRRELLLEPQKSEGDNE
jgi:hypothetical protein